MGKYLKERKVEISPSILSADFGNLLSDMEKAKGADVKPEYFHVDVMDGHFVDDITIGPPVVRWLKSCGVKLDVHLMITNPDKYIEAFAHAGAKIITVHVETCTHLHQTIRTIKDNGCKAGVVLNPATPLFTLDEVLESVDWVLLMSVNPGFAGQEFIKTVYEKIYRLRMMIHDADLPVKIEVDGGINLDNTKLVVEAGADILVAGSAIFGKPDKRLNPAKQINEMRKIIKKSMKPMRFPD